MIVCFFRINKYLNKLTNRGRFQAQGNNTEQSSAWATNDDVYKYMGSDHIDDLESKLTENEINLRNLAIQRARNFVSSCPFNGVPPLKKSFSNSLQTRSIRIDIEVNAGIAFLNNPPPQNE